jgi:zinc transport system permease protein
MLDALSYEFMRHAILAGILASLACGIIGTLVVVNRVVFLAGAVAHAAYGGVGLAYFLGWPVLPSTMGFTLVTSGIMARVTAEGDEGADTLIGALWACGMALGIILLDLTPGYAADLMSYLFGSILAVPTGDLWLMAGLDAAILGLTLYFWKDLLAVSFDREFAATRGVPVRAMHFLLLVMVGATVVMVIRVVGLILVMALMTIPTSMAQAGARSVGAMMWRAGLLSSVFCLAGLAMSYALDLTSGACIVAVAAFGYFAQRLALAGSRNGARA